MEPGAGGSGDSLKGRSLLAGIGRLDPLKTYRGQKILSMVAAVGGRPLPAPFTPELAVDLFYAFYLPVPMIDPEATSLKVMSEQDLARLSILSALLSDRRFQRIKALTTADYTTSIVAAASLAERLSRLLATSSSSGRGGEGGGLDKSIESAVSSALKQVEHDAKVAKDIKSLVARTGAGNASHLSYGDDPEAILRLARKTNVERVLKLVLGVRVSPFVDSTVTRRYSRGWLGGLEYGSDLERIHYSELALPEEVFLAKMANSRLLLYEKELPVSRGPIYVLLDKSGSMIGEKIDWARAVALALMEKSLREGRPFYVRFFDSTVYPLLRVGRRSTPSDVVRIMDYLATVKASGGTNITNAIRAAAGDLASSVSGDKVSHVVLITDGEDKIDTREVEHSKRVAQMSIISVMIQGHNHYLKRVSDRYMRVKSLSGRTLLEVVDFTAPSEGG